MIKLAGRNGKPLYLNPLHVAAVTSSSQGDCEVYIVGEGEGGFRVTESPDEVVAMLSQKGTEERLSEAQVQIEGMQRCANCLFGGIVCLNPEADNFNNGTLKHYLVCRKWVKGEIGERGGQGKK